MCGAWVTATGQKRSPVFLDMRRSPQTVLNEAFSIDFATANTKNNRDSRGRTLRAEDIVTIESWYRINPQAQDKVRDLASDTEETGRGAILSDLRSPLLKVRVRFIRSLPQIHPHGEWYVRNSVYGVSYESSIPEAS